MKLNEYLRRLDHEQGDRALWQFIKFNIVSMSVSIMQLILANILPFFFDSLQVKLPVFLRTIFDAKTLFEAESPYVVGGVVTWGYVLPFFLSNLIANIYGYYANSMTTFKTKGSRKSILIYLAVLIALILFSTWLQGRVVALLSGGKLAKLARTIAASAAGLVQLAVLFPLEKYILFKEDFR